jgi:hypothetical protein
VAESPHIPGTTTQLSGARSTTELIARRAGLPPGAAMPKERETPYIENKISIRILKDHENQKNFSNNKILANLKKKKQNINFL